MKRLSNSSSADRTGAAAPSNSASAFEGECIGYFGEIVQILGVPRSVGQIYGLLYGAKDPLSFSDIVTLLDISKGSASQGLQLLRSLGAVRVVAADEKLLADKPPAAQRAHPLDGHTRRTLYKPELSLRKLMGAVLRGRIAPFAAASSARLTRMRAIADDAGPDCACYSQKVRQLRSWQWRLRALLPVLTRLLGPKHGR